MSTFLFDASIKKKKPANDTKPEQEEYSFDATKIKKKKEKTKKMVETSPEKRKALDEEYFTLLERIFGILRENKQEKTTKKEKITMAPPKIEREGAKKTAFVNIIEISKRMQRETEHLMSYVLAELGTTGSIDGSHRLLIKGVFREEQIQSIIRKYLKEYVLCSNCKSLNTKLNKENRLLFVRCNQCGASKTVATVKSGFVAQTAKRASLKS
eukprot:GHVN01068480.1.p1 GENE.GHVN01068480.1~~GHVN01068480.1.p1  ORF type:complete len:212 (-),score=35.19 GHVN01068480.1:44-679(-)